MIVFIVNYESVTCYFFVFAFNADGKLLGDELNDDLDRILSLGINIIIRLERLKCAAYNLLSC